jgi:hypothetical protein
MHVNNHELHTESLCIFLQVNYVNSEKNKNLRNKQIVLVEDC